MENFTHSLLTVVQDRARLGSHPLSLPQVLVHAPNVTQGVTHNDVTDYVTQDVIQDNVSHNVTGAGLPMTLHVTIGVIMVVVFLLGTLGNILVIVVFGCFRSLRKPMNMLLINLAVADLLMAGCGSPMVAVSSFHGRWVLGDIGCKGYAFVMGLSGLVSVVTMSVIALERVCGVASYHLKSPLQRCGAPGTIIFIWCYSSLWVLPPLCGWSKYELESYGTACSFKFLDTTQEDLSFLVYLFVGGFVVPCCIILVSYMFLWSWVVHSQREFQRQAERMKTSVQQMRRNSCVNVELRVTKVCGLVMLMFLIAWLPYAIITLLAAFGNKTQQARITPIVCMLPGMFAKISSIYNPIIYAISHPAFKKKLQDLMCHCTLFNSPGLPAHVQAIYSQQSNKRRMSLADTSSYKPEEEELYRDCGSESGGQGVFQLKVLKDEGKVKVVVEADSELIPEGDEDSQLILDKGNQEDNTMEV